MKIIRTCVIFFNQKCQLNLKDFQNLYSIFCFDVSAQDAQITSNICDLTLLITKDEGLKVKGYCVILEEKRAKINLVDGKMITFT